MKKLLLSLLVGIALVGMFSSLGIGGSFSFDHAAVYAQGGGTPGGGSPGGGTPGGTPPPPGGSPPSGGSPGTSPSSIHLPFPNPLAPCTNIICVADKIIGVMVDISIPIVAIMVLVGAFQIITAAGNPEKFTKGLKTIEYSAVGFAAILLAGAAADVIQSALV